MHGDTIADDSTNPHLFEDPILRETFRETAAKIASLVQPSEEVAESKCQKVDTMAEISPEMQQILTATAKAAVAEMKPVFESTFAAHKQQVSREITKLDKKCDAKFSNIQVHINEIKAGGGSGASTTASEVGSNKTSFSPPAKKANQQFVESRGSRHFGQPVQALCPSVMWMCS